VVIAGVAVYHLVCWERRACLIESAKWAIWRSIVVVKIYVMVWIKTIDFPEGAGRGTLPSWTRTSPPPDRRDPSGRAVG